MLGRISSRTIIDVCTDLIFLFIIIFQCMKSWGGGGKARTNEFLLISLSIFSYQNIVCIGLGR